MVDPITIAAGFALARQSIKVCRKALDACNDVSEISTHIDHLFHSLEKKPHSESKKKKKVFSKLRTNLSNQTHEDVGDDTSLGAVAADVLEKKQLERQIYNLGVRIDNKFGEGTWRAIQEERDKRIKDKKEKLRKKKEEEKLDKIYTEEETPLAHKILIEGLKIVGLLVFAGGIIFFFMTYSR